MLSVSRPYFAALSRGDHRETVALSTAAASANRADNLVVLAAICMAALVLPLDFSGAAAATPAIGRDFDGSPVMLAWVVNAFMLSFGSTLLTAGALADEFGRKRMFGLGVTAFTVVSVAMCFSRSLLTLDLLRAVQGLAAAATLAGGSAALAQEFEGPARTRAFSLLGTTFGAGLAFGPTLAGFLIDSLGWRAIFLSGALVGVIALLFGLPRMRETHNPQASGPDWPGAVSFTTALALFTAGMLEAPELGWRSLLVAGLLIVSAVAIAGFILIELLVSRPMLNLSLFRYPRFVGVQVLPIATTFSYVVLLVLLPSRLIGIEGYREMDAGLIMLALSAPMLIVPFATALLTHWLSAGLLSFLGLIIAALGLLWLAGLPPGTPASLLMPPMAMTGFGAAMPWGLMDGLSISVVPTARAGMATGIFSTVRVAGEGIALAIVRALLAAFTQTSLIGAIKDSPLRAKASALAARMAAGDLPHAAALAPQADTALLIRAYGDGFRDLLYVLALIVALAGLVVLAILRRAPADANQG